MFSRVIVRRASVIFCGALSVLFVVLNLCFKLSIFLARMKPITKPHSIVDRLLLYWRFFLLCGSSNVGRFCTYFFFIKTSVQEPLEYPKAPKSSLFECRHVLKCH